MEINKEITKEWKIFPCQFKAKVPLTKNGFKNASNDPEQLDEWAKITKKNWGLSLGDSDLSVIDIDPRNGGNFREEEETFVFWSNGTEYKVPKTLLVKTGSGGFHLYYKGARKLPAKITEGIDLKSTGGYVIIPPSTHQNGNKYEWVNDLPIADFPECVLPKPEEIKNENQSIPDFIKNGDRNKTLFKLASSLRGKGFEENEIISTLETANKKCHIPLNHSELLTITSSVMKYPVSHFSNTGNDSFHETELSLSDLGNSERFVKLNKDRVRYCHELKTWLIWNGKYWKKDNSLEIHKFAKDVIKSIYSEASQTSDRALQSKIASWAKSSHSENKLDAMIDLSKSELPISPKDLDTHLYLLNLNNGVLNLKTGELLEHKKEYFFTDIIQIDFNPIIDCKNWKEFLDLVIPDKETQVFIQKSVGYSLTGSVDEQCLFFCYGNGANGKSTFIEAVGRLFGDLCQKTDAEALMGYSDGATPYKARMRGKRFIVSSEIPDGKKWNESLIKDLTGGETLVARDVYQSPYEFKPTFKIWITGNYKPKVTDDSYGFWRRMKLIPFETTIPENKRKPMNYVLNNFDYSGILNWALKGCLLWQKEGLKAPDKVIKATDEYKEEQDILQDFLDEFVSYGENLKIRKNVFRERFQKYLKTSGYQQEITPKKLTRLLSEKGINMGGNGNSLYIGIDIEFQYQFN